MYHPAKWSCVVLALCAGFFYAGSCHAQESGMLSGGYIHSFVFGHSPAAGNGVELSYVYYPSADVPTGIGGFLQLQSYGDHGRHALGLQANQGPFGVELGYARRGSDAEHDVTHSIHMAAFASLGVPLISFRVAPPVASGDDSHGTEFAILLGLKLFTNIHGRMIEPLQVPHGRPL